MGSRGRAGCRERRGTQTAGGGARRLHGACSRGAWLLTLYIMSLLLLGREAKTRTLALFGVGDDAQLAMPANGKLGIDAKCLLIIVVVAARVDVCRDHGVGWFELTTSSVG